jgi:hypothetical protein
LHEKDTRGWGGAEVTIPLHGLPVFGLGHARLLARRVERHFEKGTF